MDDKAAKALQAELLKVQVERDRISKEKAALLEEFVTATDEEAPEKVWKNIRAEMPDALQILSNLMHNADSESLRASIAKWYVERGLSPMSINMDPESKKLNKLLEQMKAND